MAQRERQELVGTMSAVGPDAPTLCGGWTVRDLAAHLIVRERRPDASPGIMLKSLAGYLESVQNKTAAKPFPELLDLVSSGPPLWSPMRPIDGLVNLGEMYVHHEDVRRATPDWQPRELSDEVEAKLWTMVRRMGRAYRKAEVGVTLETPDGRHAVAKRGAEPGVTLIGKPSELLLHAFGRDEVRIETRGDADAVRAVFALDRSI